VALLLVLLPPDARRPEAKPSPADAAALPPRPIAIPELIEAEAYYSVQVSTKLREVETLAKGSPELLEHLHQDLGELDHVYEELKRDLQENLSNEQVVNAMIQSYRLKLEILERLLEQLKEDQPNTANNPPAHAAHPQAI